jgi:hypothetical protein
LSAIRDEEPITEYEALRDLSEELAGMFLHWQIASILLALAFVWYTVLF